MLYVSTIWTSDTELMLSTYIVTPTLTGSPENQRVTANQRHMQKGLRSLNFYKNYILYCLLTAEIVSVYKIVFFLLFEVYKLPFILITLHIPNKM